MTGSLAIAPNPAIMENAVLRQKGRLSLSRSVLSSGNINVWGGTNTARCLFGPPDPKQSKDLVRESELKNAINFGKRFNFDVVSGEPFPSAKKIKMSPNTTCDDYDEENVNLDRSVDKEQGDGHESEGYIWAETYNQDYMEMCNKHAVNTSIIGPSRHAAVSLLFAPIIHSNHSFTSTPKSSASSHESPKTFTSQSNSMFSNTSAISTPRSLVEVISPPSETNNNVVISNKSHSAIASTERESGQTDGKSHVLELTRSSTCMCLSTDSIQRIKTHLTL